ncbi:M-phase-specific PLK1-interacting protein [Brienomyrus brachyistius]|uniref:M-phase-specific PLK1-interacting protein n=1 Tax=Brienomyrus brachyistius TaxID=42636 RepID=UPI0020B39AF1|nr:M-phase-specific PLK1-interacting protein [Brienomyrus brachyistius]
MHRPNFRPPAPPGGMGPRPGGYRSPTAGFDSGGAVAYHPPPWAFPNGPPPSFGPRIAQYCGSPDTPPRDFHGSNNCGGGKGRFYGSPSPGRTPRRPSASPRFTPPYKKSPYHSESPGHHKGYQGSPRTSTPFGPTHGRERVANGVEAFYNPAMLQDPWAGLQPVAVTDAKAKSSTEQASHTGRRGRYFNR